MKQTEANPWTLVAESAGGTLVEGEVRNLTNYGAFMELEEGIDGLLHVSDMSWTRKISHPSECVEKGQKVIAFHAEIRVLSQLGRNRVRCNHGQDHVRTALWTWRGCFHSRGLEHRDILPCGP